MFRGNLLLDKQINRLKKTLETREAKIKRTELQLQRKQTEVDQSTQSLKRAKQGLLEKDKALDTLKKKYRTFSKNKKE